MANVLSREGHIIQDPKIVQRLFNDTKFALLWLPIRIWLGYKWIDAALHKVGDPAWVSSGEALKGFWSYAVTVPAEGRPPISFDWYRAFLQFLLETESYTWFAKFVAYGELLVGIGLILGAFTGIAAFFGALMNFNFMLAGTASTNPVLFIAALGLIFAWKISGYLGADFFLLRWIGVPWRPYEKEKAE